MHSKKHSLVFFLLITQVLISLVCAIVYAAVIDIVNVGEYAFALKIFFIALPLSFLASSFISHKYDNWFSRSLYSFSAIWLGLLFYAFFTAALYFIGLLAILHLDMPLSQQVLGAVLFLAAALVVLFGFANAGRIQVTKFHLSFPHLSEFWFDKRAVFVSDLHLGQVRGKGFAQTIVNKINTINPDIIFIGGDLFDGVRVHASEIIEPLRDLHPKLGIYFVTGNHEYMSGQSAEFISVLELIGIKVLKDEVVTIEGLQIVGVDYRDSVQTAAYDALFPLLTLDHSKPSILLKHTPFHIEIAEKHGIDVQLSGHTHHAQMFPGNIITKRLFKGYDYGLKTFGKMIVYTSSGVGTWGPPMRVGTKSELVVIDFKQNNT